MCHSPLYKLRTGWAYRYSVRRPAVESGLPVISRGNEKLVLQKPQAGAETCLLQVAGPVKARAFSSIRWEPSHKDEVDRHLTNTSSIVLKCGNRRVRKMPWQGPWEKIGGVTWPQPAHSLTLGMSAALLLQGCPLRLGRVLHFVWWEPDTVPRRLMWGQSILFELLEKSTLPALLGSNSETMFSFLLNK